MKGSLVAKLGLNLMVSVRATARFKMVLKANTAACSVAEFLEPFESGFISLRQSFRCPG